jgi:proteasome assembly chaperone (PAC2) family protein
MKGPFKLSWQPELRGSSLIVGWSMDSGKLGTRITDYLNGQLGSESFCEIDPVEFFSLGGVIVEENLVQFPESKFYASPRNNLAILKSAPPRYEWYRFLNLVLDVAERYCNAKEIITIGGMVSLSAHTTPRELMGTFNSPEVRDSLSRYNLASGMEYETPPGQRPTLNSFLIWAAGRRNIPAFSLWVPIPFYLMTVDDAIAQRMILELFNQKFGLELDFSEMEDEIERQNQILADMRNASPDIDKSIRRLEQNLMLSNEESQRLVGEVERLFRGKKP